MLFPQWTKFISLISEVVLGAGAIAAGTIMAEVNPQAYLLHSVNIEKREREQLTCD